MRTRVPSKWLASGAVAVVVALGGVGIAPREKFPLSPLLSSRLPRPTRASGLLVAAYVPIAPEDAVDAEAPPLTDPMSE